MTHDLGGDVSLTTGNVDFVQVGLNGRLSWVRGSTMTLLIGEGGLGFLSGDRFASAGLLHLRRTYWLSERVAPEWFGQLNYDRPLLLDFRALAGAGVRLRFSSGAWGAAGAGPSLMYEEERLDLPAAAVHPEKTETVSSSTFLTLRLVAGESLVVSSTAYAQPALADVLGDVRVLENCGCRRRSPTGWRSPWRSICATTAAHPTASRRWTPGSGRA
jgi:hypothetical protein